MKNYKILLLFFIIVFFFACQNDKPNINDATNKTIKSIKLQSEQDSIDYALGVVIGNQMKKYGISEVNYSVFSRAIKDVMTNDNYNLPINSNKAKNIISLYVKETKNRKVVKYIDQNSIFFQQNEQKNGIKSLPNGMQYKIISKGSGKIPNLSDRVMVHYSGRLVDNTVFVSTLSSQPVSFLLRNSLAGWQSAITKMNVGSEWIIYLPPELAYGDKGSKSVPPNSIVIYRIKLLKIL